MVDAGMLGAMNVQTTDYRRLSEADRHPRLYMHTAYTSYMYLGYISFWSSGSIHQKVNVRHILAITFPSVRTPYILVNSQQKGHKSN